MCSANMCSALLTAFAVVFCWAQRAWRSPGSVSSCSQAWCVVLWCTSCVQTGLQCLLSCLNQHHTSQWLLVVAKLLQLRDHVLQMLLPSTAAVSSCFAASAAPGCLQAEARARAEAAAKAKEEQKRKAEEARAAAAEAARRKQVRALSSVVQLSRSYSIASCSVRHSSAYTLP
jgi:ribosomal protein L12E/L44/L45/RPP1/RPP2